MTPNEVKLDQAALEKAAFYLRVATMAAGSDTSKITWSELAAAAITAYLSALQATPTSGEQVVAWRYRWKFDGVFNAWEYMAARPSEQHHLSQIESLEEQPLFAAPPSPLPDRGDGLREAADLLAGRVEAILGQLGPGGYLLPSGAVKTNDLQSVLNEYRAIRTLKSTPPQPVAGEPGMEAQTETVKP